MHRAALLLGALPARRNVVMSSAPHCGSNLGPRCTPRLAPHAASTLKPFLKTLAHSRTHALTWRRRRCAARPHGGTLPVGLPGRPDAGRSHRGRQRRRPSPCEPSCRRAAAAAAAAAHGPRGAAARGYAVARRCADDRAASAGRGPKAAIGRTALDGPSPQHGGPHLHPTGPCPNPHPSPHPNPNPDPNPP